MEVEGHVFTAKQILFCIGTRVKGTMQLLGANGVLCWPDEFIWHVHSSPHLKFAFQVRCEEHNIKSRH